MILHRKFITKSILILSLLFLSFNLFGKETKKLPDEIQAKIKTIKETKESWYIRTSKGTRVGKILYGPFEDKNQAIAVWIYLDIEKKNNISIAQKDKYITDNPKDFYTEDYEEIENYFKQIGDLLTLKCYFGLSTFPQKTEEILTTEIDETLPEIKNEEITETTETENIQNNNSINDFDLNSDDNYFGDSSGFTDFDLNSDDSTFASSDFDDFDDFDFDFDFDDSFDDSFDNSFDDSFDDSFDGSFDNSFDDSFDNSFALNNSNSEDSFTQDFKDIKEPDLNNSSQNKNENLYSNNNQTINSTETENSTKDIQNDQDEKVTQSTVDFVIPQSDTSLPRYQKTYLQDYAPDKSTPVPYDEEEVEEYTILNPNEKDNKGCTLLMKAAEAGNNWELNALLKSGADVNQTDNDGWTALMYAVRYQQNISIVNSLIQAGANIKVKNKYNLSALMIASTYNSNPEIISKLLSYYSVSEKEVLQSFILLLSDNSSSEYSKIAKVEIFIKKSIPLNAFYEGKTPLMYAAEFGTSTKLLKYLIDEGASTAIRSTEGKTAFDYAMNNKALIHDENFWSLNHK